MGLPGNQGALDGKDAADKQPLSPSRQADEIESDRFRLFESMDLR
jgi:hypothetical protein